MFAKDPNKQNFKLALIVSANLNFFVYIYSSPLPTSSLSSSVSFPTATPMV